MDGKIELTLKHINALMDGNTPIDEVSLFIKLLPLYERYEFFKLIRLNNSCNLIYQFPYIVL